MTRFFFLIVAHFIINYCLIYCNIHDTHARGGDTVRTPTDVDALLEAEDARHFLLALSNDYQRDVITQHLRNCPYTPLCGFQFELRPIPGEKACCVACSCEFPDCMITNTCCPDIIFNNTDLSSQTSFTVVDLERLTGKNVQKSCISSHLSENNLVPVKRYVFGYTSCPLSVHEDLWRNCTRPYTSEMDSFTDIVPVVRKASRDLYRNKYCAYCNYVFDDEFQTLEIRLSCLETIEMNTEQGVIEVVLEKDKCDMEFLTEVELEYCEHAISECNETGLWALHEAYIETACSLYTSVITINNRSFQNVFCSYCNGIYPTRVVCLPDGHTQSGDFSFSGLLKLDRAQASGIFKPSDNTCSENQLYDKILGTCRDLHCSVIASLEHGECVDIYAELKELVYTTFLRIKPTGELSMSDSYIVANDVITTYTSQFGHICDAQLLLQSSAIFNENNLHDIENTTLLYFSTRVKSYVQYPHDPNDIVDSFSLPRNFSISYKNKIIYFETEISNSDPKPFEINSILSLHENTDTIARDFIPLPLTTLIREYAFSGVGGQAVIPYVGNTAPSCEGHQTSDINVHWLQPCPKVKIAKSELPWRESADGITITHGNHTLKHSAFYYADDNNIMICAEAYKDYMSKVPPIIKQPLSTETIVSVVSSSISIFALSLTLATFCIFPNLRLTIPGKNNISLVVSLLCAQSVYMSGSLITLETESVECLILGLLVHFTWLVAIFWMNCCTFHMFRVLVKTQVMSHRSGMKQVIIYHAYTLIMAAICVSVNVIVSYYNSDDLGYGGDVCYISSQEMVLYTFGVPTAFVVISNMCMFTIVIIKIKRSSSVPRNVQHERNDLIVFAKLSTITGATWIFGFLYMWTNVIAMSYLFIILNAGQGVFIMLAFIINRRVYDLLISSMTSTKSTSLKDGTPTVKSTLHTQL